MAADDAEQADHHTTEAGSLWEDHTRVTPLEHFVAQLESIFQSQATASCQSAEHHSDLDVQVAFLGLPYRLCYAQRSVLDPRPEWNTILRENALLQRLLCIPNQIASPSDFCTASHYWTLEAKGKSSVLDKEAGKWLLSAMRLASHRSGISARDEAFFVSGKGFILGIDKPVTCMYEYASHQKEWQRTDSIAANYQRLAREPESAVVFEAGSASDPPSHQAAALHQTAAITSSLYDADGLTYEVDAIYTRVDASLLLENICRLYPQYYILHAKRLPMAHGHLRLSRFLRLLTEPLDPHFASYLKQQHRPKSRPRPAAETRPQFKLFLTNADLVSHLRESQAYIPPESRLHVWLERMLALFLPDTVDRDPKEILLLEWQSFLELELREEYGKEACAGSPETKPEPGACLLAQRTQHLRKLDQVIRTHEAQDLDSEAKLKFLQENDLSRSFLTDWRRELMDRLDAMRKEREAGAERNNIRSSVSSLDSDPDPGSDTACSTNSGSDSDSVFYDSRMELFDPEHQVGLHSRSSITTPSYSPPPPPSLFPSLALSLPTGRHSALLDAQGRPVSSQSDPSQYIHVPETLVFPPGHEKRQLVSDMSAFKAANHPNIDFVDFLLWYSPRDCQAVAKETAATTTIESCSMNREQRANGTIAEAFRFEPSGRMRAADNIWLSLWASAARQPAVEQSDWWLSQRLERERTLAQLKTMDPQDLLLQWLPTLYSLVYEYLKEWAAAFGLTAERVQALKGLENVLRLFPWRSLETAGLSALEAPLAWSVKVEATLAFLSALPESFRAAGQLDTALRLERGESIVLHPEHDLYAIVKELQNELALKEQTLMVGLKGRAKGVAHEFVFIEKKGSGRGGLLEIKILE